MNQTKKYRKDDKTLLANLKTPHVQKLCQTTNLVGPQIQIYMYLFFYNKLFQVS